MTPGEPASDIEANETQPLLGGAGASPERSPTAPLQDIKTILYSNYINVLLVSVPFALVSGALEWSPRTVFITNSIALMPLASLLTYGTEELSKTAGKA